MHKSKKKNHNLFSYIFCMARNVTQSKLSQIGVFGLGRHMSGDSQLHICMGLSNQQKKNTALITLTGYFECINVNETYTYRYLLYYF